MTDHQSAVPQTIHKSIRINAPKSEVWKTLTEPDLMKKWMSDSEIEIITTWEVGSPIIVNVQEISYKTSFTNNGIVLQFLEDHILEYTHLSSLSRLPDEPENRTIIKFTLQQEEPDTLLNLDLSNFPTESHYKHIDFYWTITLNIIKQSLEEK
ncbi:SRPBCC family protein [Mucilaginibacter sp. X4EP1]|uniref:SRPBCC family protein n=1 Tax=Mucilaginibacter sp. X4EP1 TaxID=2723092 RepID=UPI002168E68A|nr:SRPBCC domain-containing protein [Mucilaginibacter sp. X4EP1]MCS3815553.1 uncharacterized protein YndB with AHSA1/START domain [Mucilaginibacter sp. X4EP1]